MQLLYVANRYEKKPQIEQLLAAGDGDHLRSLSGVEHRVRRSAGPRRRVAREIQRYLPPPDLTILLDIAPETAARPQDRQPRQYERDLALLSRVRESYRRQAAEQRWLRLDGERDRRTPSPPTSSQPSRHGS